ncbi:MAG: hypothetical protein IJA35_02500 [Clostridia bacterium]|nr:hypothetical protein [Clostridia bacterium]
MNKKNLFIITLAAMVLMCSFIACHQEDPYERPRPSTTPTPKPAPTADPSFTMLTDEEIEVLTERMRGFMGGEMFSNDVGMSVANIEDYIYFYYRTILDEYENGYGRVPVTETDLLIANTFNLTFPLRTQYDPEKDDQHIYYLDDYYYIKLSDVPDPYYYEFISQEINIPENAGASSDTYEIIVTYEIRRTDDDLLAAKAIVTVYRFDMSSLGFVIGNYYYDVSR